MRLARRVIDDSEGADAVRPKTLPLGSQSLSVAQGVPDARAHVRLLRPLQARSEQARIAERFDAICSAMDVSNRQLARRLCVDERRVRQYRLGERPIPTDVWARINRPLAETFLTQLLARVRGERPR